MGKELGGGWALMSFDTFHMVFSFTYLQDECVCVSGLSVCL